MVGSADVDGGDDGGDGATDQCGVSVAMGTWDVTVNVLDVEVDSKTT